MMNLGGPEMLLLGILALLLFGPKRLPELGRALGQGLAAFRESSSQLKQDFTRQLEEETRKEHPVASRALPDEVLLPPVETEVLDERQEEESPGALPQPAHASPMNRARPAAPAASPETAEA